MLYLEIKDGATRVAIKRLADNSFIPLDAGNIDYAEFLRLVDELGEGAILQLAE